jgi:hypothetical protein
MQAAHGLVVENKAGAQVGGLGGHDAVLVVILYWAAIWFPRADIQVSGSLKSVKIDANPLSGTLS